MRINRTRLIWSMTVLSFLGGTIYTLFSGEDASSAPAAVEGTRKPAEVVTAEESSFNSNGNGKSEGKSDGESAGSSVPPTAPSTPPPGSAGASGSCLADPVALEDMQRQRETLQGKHRELLAKEAELKALEKNVNDELKQLEQIRLDMQKIEAMRKSENDDKVNRIVETLQSMSPKTAAALLSSMDEALAVTAIARMATERLAKVMNNMDASRASRLTELLAGVVRAKNAVPPQVASAARAERRSASLDAAASTSKSAKGGDKK